MDRGIQTKIGCLAKKKEYYHLPLNSISQSSKWNMNHLHLNERSFNIIPRNILTLELCSIWRRQSLYMWYIEFEREKERDWKVVSGEGSKMAYWGF